MATTNKINKKSLVEQVYIQLLNRIFSNEYSYGDTLNVKALSEELGISTMPTREAIKRLEYDNIVEIKPRSHCAIKTFTKKEIKEIYELREVLEIHAIRKFLNNFKPQKLTALKSVISMMKKVNKNPNLQFQSKRAIELDNRFHAELCKLSGNNILSKYHKLLSLYINMKSIHEQTFQVSAIKHIESHSIIVDELENGSDVAILHLKKHFKNVKNLIN
jgi:DNA-binding GntR family transcriptional regulator